jgi:hypothetical protein
MASQFHSTALREMLNGLPSLGTPVTAIIIFECKLSQWLCVPYMQSFHRHLPLTHTQDRILTQATRHQNIIGWDNFLRGYISHHWASAYHAITDPNIKTTKTPWPQSAVSAALTLSFKIWSHRNTFVHRKTKKGHHDNERARLIQIITAIYNNPPKLHSRYTPITFIPLASRLKSSTGTLKRWLSRIQHQLNVTSRLHQNHEMGQLTIQQASAKCYPDMPHKFPP